MTTVGGNAPTNNIPQNTPPQTEGPKKTEDAKKPETGGGVAAPDGKSVPDSPNTKPASGDAMLSAILEGLTSLLMGQVKSPKDLEVLVAEVVGKIKDKIEATQEGKIKNETENQRAINQEKLSKIEQSLKKLEESGALKNASGIMGWFKIALSFISSVVQIGVGIAMIASGNPLGAFLIAKGGLDLLGAADSALKQATGNGIAGNIAKAFGASEDAAMWADVGFTGTLAIATIFVSIASLRVDGAAEAMAKGAKMVADVEGVVTGLVTSGLDIATAINGYNAAEKQGDSIKMQAEKAKLDAILGKIGGELTTAFQKMSKGGEDFMAVLQQMMESIKGRSETIDNQQFKA